VELVELYVGFPTCNHSQIYYILLWSVVSLLAKFHVISSIIILITVGRTDRQTDDDENRTSARKVREVKNDLEMSVALVECLSSINMCYHLW